MPRLLEHHVAEAGKIPKKKEKKKEYVRYGTTLTASRYKHTLQPLS
jgi:hypothetical protein